MHPAHANVAMTLNAYADVGPVLACVCCVRGYFALADLQPEMAPQ